MIDNNDGRGPLLFFQLQTKLFLYRLENRITATGIGRRSPESPGCPRFGWTKGRCQVQRENWVERQRKIPAPWIPVESKIGEMRFPARPCNKSANWAMVMFWQIKACEPCGAGGAPGI